MQFIAIMSLVEKQYKNEHISFKQLFLKFIPAKRPRGERVYLGHGLCWSTYFSICCLEWNKYSLKLLGSVVQSSSITKCIFTSKYKEKYAFQHSPALSNRFACWSGQSFSWREYNTNVVPLGNILNACKGYLCYIFLISFFQQFFNICISFLRTLATCWIRIPGIVNADSFVDIRPHFDLSRICSCFRIFCWKNTR